MQSHTCVCSSSKFASAARSFPWTVDSSLMSGGLCVDMMLRDASSVAPFAASERARLTVSSCLATRAACVNVMSCSILHSHVCFVSGIAQSSWGSFHSFLSSVFIMVGPCTFLSITVPLQPYLYHKGANIFKKRWEGKDLCVV